MFVSSANDKEGHVYTDKFRLIPSVNRPQVRLKRLRSNSANAFLTSGTEKERVDVVVLKLLFNDAT